MTRHHDETLDPIAAAELAELDAALAGDPAGAEWAALVAAALGGARVEPRADTTRYLDVTVLLGASWRPPAEALDP